MRRGPYLLECDRERRGIIGRRGSARGAYTSFDVNTCDHDVLASHCPSTCATDEGLLSKERLVKSTKFRTYRSSYKRGNLESDCS